MRILRPYIGSEDQFSSWQHNNGTTMYVSYHIWNINWTYRTTLDMAGVCCVHSIVCNIEEWSEYIINNWYQTCAWVSYKMSELLLVYYRMRFLGPSGELIIRMDYVRVHSGSNAFYSRVNKRNTFRSARLTWNPQAGYPSQFLVFIRSKTQKNDPLFCISFN